MTQPKFSMVHQPDLYEETIVDGFAIYAFLSYSDCEESVRQQDCLDTEEEESMTEDKRTPTNVGRTHPYSSGYNRSSINDTPSNGSIYLENGKNILFHRSVARRKAGRPKGKGHHQSKVRIKHELFIDYRDASIDAQQLNCLYNDYLEDRYKEEEENKYKFTFPKSMDENFVNSSLNALDSSFVKERPILKVDKIKKELKQSIQDTPDYYNSKEESFVRMEQTPEIDADLTEMISRHSKREIRLPARYHQSGLLMGSQWVIPEYNSPDDKVPRKRIKIEVDPEEPNSQNEMQVRITQSSSYQEKLAPQPLRQPLSQPQQSNHQQPAPTPTPTPSPSPSPPQLPQLPPPPLLLKPQLQQNQHSPLVPRLIPQTHFKPLYSCENQRIILSTSNSNNLVDRTVEDDKSLSADLFIETKGSVTNNVDDIVNLNSPTKTCPSHVSQLKLHQEKLERLQALRKQQEACSKLNENTTVIINIKDYQHQESTVDVIMGIPPTDQSDLNNIDPSSSQSSSCCSPELNHQNLLNSVSSMVPSHLSILNPQNNSSQSSSDSLMDNSDVQDSKSPKQQELCKLYRDLHFANRPERRLLYFRSRIKPRVIKKMEVEEAVKVIEKLKKRERQLLYIKKLLSMWNEKLVLASKVSNDKELNQNAINVVKDVLKTYQASKGYKVTKAWEAFHRLKNSSPSLTSISSCLLDKPPPPSQPSQQTLQHQSTLQSVQHPVHPPPPPPSQSSRQLVRPGSSVIKTTGSLSRIVINPQAKLKSSPESRVITTLTLPVVTTTTTITSTAKTIDQPTEKSPTVAVINKITTSPPRIKAMVPLNQSQSSNQPSHLHIHPSLPPPPPPSLQASFSLTSLMRPTNQALPTLSTPLPNHAHLAPSILPNIQHSQASIKQIPLIISPGPLSNNLLSSTRGYGNSRIKPLGDVHLCTMPRLPLSNNVTPVNPVASSGVNPKPTIIKPTTIVLTPNANPQNSPVYRILVKGDTLNRVLLTPQITPHIYKKPLLREPFLGPPLDSPVVEVNVQSDNQGCN